MRIPFMKMSGSGNDFILIDHRKSILNEDRMKGFARKVCQRRVSVGADGLILIERSEKTDFRWRFFNADGSEPEMCGNGGRCAARFAFLKGISGSSLTFETLAGTLYAQVDGKRVKLEMTKPYGLKLDEKILIEGKEQTVSSINTGVPHAVLFLNDIESMDITQMGRAIRYHPHFSPAGTNANFVRLEKDAHLSIRTYERGVEDETLACGTGAVASALIAAFKGLVRSPVSMRTRGGEILTVHFELGAGEVKKVFFEGDVHIIYEAEMWEEAYQ
ncbi:MAG: diaminopimelate epimerase [Thermodesulfobacteriota bacterium]|nr:diaminopimelate epimerase [Thermodesulfobacteriota bacterium]